MSPLLLGFVIGSSFGSITSDDTVEVMSHVIGRTIPLIGFLQNSYDRDQVTDSPGAKFLRFQITPPAIPLGGLTALAVRQDASRIDWKAWDEAMKPLAKSLEVIPHFSKSIARLSLPISSNGKSAVETPEERNLLWVQTFGLAYWLNVENEFKVDSFELPLGPNSATVMPESEYLSVLKITRNALEAVYSRYLPLRKMTLLGPTDPQPTAHSDGSVRDGKGLISDICALGSEGLTAVTAPVMGTGDTVSKGLQETKERAISASTGALPVWLEWRPSPSVGSGTASEIANDLIRLERESAGRVEGLMFDASSSSATQMASFQFAQMGILSRCSMLEAHSTDPDLFTLVTKQGTQHLNILIVNSGSVRKSVNVVLNRALSAESLTSVDWSISRLQSRGPATPEKASISPQGVIHLDLEPSSVQVITEATHTK